MTIQAWVLKANQQMGSNNTKNDYTKRLYEQVQKLQEKEIHLTENEEVKENIEDIFKGQNKHINPII